MPNDRFATAAAIVLLSTVTAGCDSVTTQAHRALVTRSRSRGRPLNERWARAQLWAAAQQFHRVFSQEGAEGHLRLRLRRPELDAFFTENGIHRIERLPVGLSPSPGEQRWHMFSVLGDSTLVGYCARGIRITEPNGPEGFKVAALVVDRLLIVGSERDGLWGAWIEGLMLTPEGWRLLPTVPFERQVETPRRDHTDVQLWDCDLGERTWGTTARRDH